MIRSIIFWCGKHSRLTIIAAALLGIWGIYSLKNIRIDAIPDLSETQVIIFTEWMGRSPDLVEGQITYPLVTAMLSAPNVEVVRGFSMFGMSFVYVIFQDGTDLYWARSRVMEYLSQITGNLPSGAVPTLGPDATGVGWIFQYVLEDTTGTHDLAELRSFQDWRLRYWLASVPGVAEVASVGGFEKQYQVEVDPNRLAVFNISIDRVMSSIRMSNSDVGGRTLEMSEREYYVRGRGYITSTKQIEDIVVGLGPNNTPIRVADIARVNLGPNIRRGLVDVDGTGDAVGGVVVLRQQEDVSRVIAALKARISEVQAGLPAGVELKVVYDRSIIIQEAVTTLQNAIIEEIIIVCLIIFLFLFHFRSVLVVVIALPLSLLVAMIPLYYLDIGLNIMSMGGIIIAIGDIVDGMIVFIENSHKKLAESNGSRPHSEIVLEACAELGPAIFSALLIIGISFLPIFALQAQEGKLFHPLAYTKTFAMLAAVLVTITVTPPLIMIFAKGKIKPERERLIARKMQEVYRTILDRCLINYKWVLAMTLGAVILAAFAYNRLGSEFMPDLWEGDLLYMPITLPGISVTATTDLLTRQGEAIKSIPEVETVFGKAGRYETATDPAPLSMLEYTIKLLPRNQWRKGLTEEKLIAELDEVVTVPGLNRAWTKPIRGRIDMLSTGIRTPVGIKIFGDDVQEIERIGLQLEAALQQVKGTRSVYAERIISGYYLDFEPDHRALQRYGLNVGDAQMVVESAIGGMEISQTIEGQERYTINVRYPRELRDNVESLSRVLVKSPSGADIPLGQLGKFVTRMGPAMLLNEGGSLAGYVYIDLEDRDPGSYVAEAREIVEREITLPPGYFVSWTGQYEYLARMQERMKVVLPLTLVLIFAFLYFSMRSVIKSLMIMGSVPLSLVGGIFLMWVLNYNMSVAVWAGAIALIGVAVETTSIMVVYLDKAWEKRKADNRLIEESDMLAATLEGAQNSFRPVLMAATTNLLGLVPVMLAVGIGADVMRRITSPMFGGLISLTLLTLIVIPIIYRTYATYAFRKELSNPTNSSEVF